MQTNKIVELVMDADAEKTGAYLTKVFNAKLALIQNNQPYTSEIKVPEGIRGNIYDLLVAELKKSPESANKDPSELILDMSFNVSVYIPLGELSQNPTENDMRQIHHTYQSLLKSGNSAFGLTWKIKASLNEFVG